MDYKSPAGSAHGEPDWRADPDEVTDPCIECEGRGCERCDGTGNEPDDDLSVEEAIEALEDARNN